MPLTEKDTFALAQALANYLEANTIGVQATDLFIQQLPETPQVGTVVVLTGGPILAEDPTRRVSFQIQHRNTDVSSGLSKSVEINNLLNNRWNVLEDFPGRFTAVSEAGISFKDDSGNMIFVNNYVFTSTTQR